MVLAPGGQPTPASGFGTGASSDASSRSAAAVPPGLLKFLPARASAPYLGVAGSPPTQLDWCHGAPQDTDQEHDNFYAAAS